MRTVIAPLSAEVERDLAGTEARVAGIARRYIRRLALQPLLGVPVERGLLADYAARRVYFDERDRPEEMFGARRPALRTGGQDPSCGPRFRLLYWTGRARTADVRVIVILAVGPAHPDPPQPDVYELAGRRLAALVGIATQVRRPR